jgi:hypothetical protein
MLYKYGVCSVCVCTGVKPFDKTVHVLTDFFTGVLLDYCAGTDNFNNKCLLHSYSTCDYRVLTILYCEHCANRDVR